MNNWLIFDLVFYNCVGVHGDLDAYEDGGIHACERCQAYKMPPPPPPPHQLDQLVEKERLGCFIIWHYPMDAVFFPLCSVLPVNGKKRSIEKQALIGGRVVAITAYLDFRS